MNPFRLLLVVTLVITLVGCSPYPDAIPSRSDEQNLGPTNIQYGTFREGLAVVVWNDLAFPAEHGSVGSSMGISADARKVEYSLTREASDGRTLKWNAVTSDGKTGTVTINGTQYRLEDGPIFLVRMGVKAARVTQVKCDLSDLKPSAHTWDLLGKQNPEVKKFLDEVGGAR